MQMLILAVFQSTGSISAKVSIMVWFNNTYSTVENSSIIQTSHMAGHSSHNIFHQGIIQQHMVESGTRASVIPSLCRLAQACRGVTDALPASVREQHTQIEVSAWFRLADKGGDGKSISILEWVQLAISMAALVTGAGMHDIFSSYDRDGPGFLGQTEFENAAEDLGFGECAPRHRRPLDCT